MWVLNKRTPGLNFKTRSKHFNVLTSEGTGTGACVKIILGESKTSRVLGSVAC